MQFHKWKLPDYANEVNLQLAAKKSSENLPEKKKITVSMAITHTFWVQFEGCLCLKYTIKVRQCVDH